MKGGMTLEGGAEMAKALASLSMAMSRRVMSEELVDAAGPMQDRMGELAPEDPDDPPIHLKHEIVIQVVRGEDKREVSVAVGPSKRGWYGSMQEFGTAHHAAQPFARPAFDQTWAAVVMRFGSGLWLALAKRGKLTFRTGNIIEAPSSVEGEV